jgi:hypothetical protein
MVGGIVRVGLSFLLTMPPRTLADHCAWNDRPSGVLAVWLLNIHPWPERQSKNDDDY